MLYYFIFFIYFFDFSFLHLTMELFVFIVYGFYYCLLSYFVDKAAVSLDLFEFEDDETYADLEFICLTLNYYSSLENNLLTRTFYTVDFVDGVVSSVSGRFFLSDISSRFKNLHNFYKNSNINYYVSHISSSDRGNVSYSLEDACTLG